MMYSEDLILTLRKNPAIKEVHFTAGGDHFFRVFEHSMGVFGQFIGGVPVIKTKISKSVYREEILNGGERKPDPPADTKGKPGKK